LTATVIHAEAESAAALESRNHEQTATDRNQVLEQSNIEIWLAQGPYEPRAGVKAGETTDDSARSRCGR